MLSGLYFWKGKSGTPSMKKVILFVFVIIVLLAGAFTGYWYYFIKLPADALQIQQEQAAQKRLTEMTSVKDWYTKSLEGGSIDFAIDLLSEYHRNLLRLISISMPIKEASYTCTMKSCHIGLTLESGHVLTQPELTFIGNTYAASFPISKGKVQTDISALEYNNMTIPKAENNMLAAFRENKKIELYNCNEVISYVKAYNSILHTGKGKTPNGSIVFKTLPKSSVIDLEKNVSGQIKTYGMLFSEWSMEFVEPDQQKARSDILMQAALYKQAYRNAFLIRKIETIKDGIKVSGGLVCKA